MHAIVRSLNVVVDSHERNAVITFPSPSRPEPVMIVVEPDPVEGAWLVTDPFGLEPVWCDTFAEALDEAIGEAVWLMVDRLDREVRLWREEFLPRRERAG